MAATTGWPQSDYRKLGVRLSNTPQAPSAVLSAWERLLLMPDDAPIKRIPDICIRSDSLCSLQAAISALLCERERPEWFAE
jgi:hypothetical protein